MNLKERDMHESLLYSLLFLFMSFTGGVGDDSSDFGILISLVYAVV